MKGRPPCATCNRCVGASRGHERSAARALCPKAGEQLVYRWPVERIPGGLIPFASRRHPVRARPLAAPGGTEELCVRQSVRSPAHVELRNLASADAVALQTLVAGQVEVCRSPVPKRRRDGVVGAVWVGAARNEGRARGVRITNLIDECRVNPRVGVVAPRTVHLGNTRRIEPDIVPGVALLVVAQRCWEGRAVELWGGLEEAGASGSTIVADECDQRVRLEGATNEGPVRSCVWCPSFVVLVEMDPETQVDQVDSRRGRRRSAAPSDDARGGPP